MLSKIKIKLKFFAVLTFIYSFFIQNSFADLSEIDRWNYIKSLIGSRINLNSKLLNEIITESASAQEIREKYELIFSLVKTEYSSFQKLSLESPLISDKPLPEYLFLTFLHKIYVYDFIPWLSLLEKMARGENSFNSPMMRKILEKLNQSFSGLESYRKPKEHPQLFEPAMITALYLEVNHQISKIKKLGIDKPRGNHSFSDQEKTLEAIAVMTIQNNIGLLKALRKHLFALMDVNQKAYIINLNQSKLFDGNIFVETLEKVFNKTDRFNRVYKGFRREIFSLDKRLKTEIQKKGLKNLEITNLLRFEIKEEKIIKDISYFEKILLPLLSRKSKFLEDSLNKGFCNLNDKLDFFIKSANDRNQMFKKLLGISQIFIESTFKVTEESTKLGDVPFTIKTDDWLRNELDRQKFFVFFLYTHAKAMPYFLALQHKTENLEKEIESLLRQIKDLKKLLKNAGTLRRSAARSMDKENVRSFIEREDEKQSLSPITQEALETPLNFDKNDVEQENVEILKMNDSSKETPLLEPNQTGESSRVLHEIEEGDLSDIEEGVEIFSQPIEDEYTEQIREKVKGKHLEVLRAIFSRPIPKIRFETLQSLVKRCGGSLRFDGGGSSHFQITLPGGYTGRSWRPHGGAHSQKIQMRAMEGFQDALRGIANILGITDEEQQITHSD